VRGAGAIRVAAVEAQKIRENGFIMPDLASLGAEVTLKTTCDLFGAAVLRGRVDEIRSQLGVLICTAVVVAGVAVDDGIAHAEAAADRNSHKPGWRQCPLRVLFDKLEEETREFLEALANGPRWEVFLELGDLVWVAVMIADHDCTLGEWTREAEGEEQASCTTAQTPTKYG